MEQPAGRVTTNGWQGSFPTGVIEQIERLDDGMLKRSRWTTFDGGSTKTFMIPTI